MREREGEEERERGEGERERERGRDWAAKMGRQNGQDKATSA